MINADRTLIQTTKLQWEILASSELGSPLMQFLFMHWLLACVSCDSAEPAESQRASETTKHPMHQPALWPRAVQLYLGGAAGTHLQPEACEFCIPAFRQQTWGRKESGRIWCWRAQVNQFYYTRKERGWGWRGVNCFVLCTDCIKFIKMCVLWRSAMKRMIKKEKGFKNSWWILTLLILM